VISQQEMVILTCQKQEFPAEKQEVDRSAH
jgi:hypothetical protein